jgi:hypothetical protein
MHNLFPRTFSVSKQQKTHINFAKHTFKTCARKLPVHLLADFSQKRSVKLLAIVKSKAYNRINTTSVRSELVGNELKSSGAIAG